MRWKIGIRPILKFQHDKFAMSADIYVNLPGEVWSNPVAKIVFDHICVSPPSSRRIASKTVGQFWPNPVYVSCLPHLRPFNAKHLSRHNRRFKQNVAKLNFDFPWSRIYGY